MSGDGTIKAGLSLTQNSITARVRHVWQKVCVQSLLHERTVLLRVGIDKGDPPVAELVMLGWGLAMELEVALFQVDPDALAVVG